MTEAKVETRRPPQAWLMVLWLICTLVVVGFALFSYISGWWQKQVQ